jgi:hypothetical protein
LGVTVQRRQEGYFADLGKFGCQRLLQSRKSFPSFGRHKVVFQFLAQSFDRVEFGALRCNVALRWNVVDKQTSLGPTLLARAECFAGVARRVVENDHGRLIDRLTEIVHDPDNRLGVNVALVQIGLGTAALMLETDYLHIGSMSAGDRHVGSLTDREPTVGDDAFERKSRFVKVHHVQSRFGKQLREFLLRQSKRFSSPLFRKLRRKSFQLNPNLLA